MRAGFQKNFAAGDGPLDPGVEYECADQGDDRGAIRARVRFVIFEGNRRVSIGRRSRPSNVRLRSIAGPHVPSLGDLVPVRIGTACLIPA